MAASQSSHEVHRSAKLNDMILKTIESQPFRRKISILQHFRNRILPTWLRFYGVQFSGRIWLHGTLPSISRDAQSKIIIGDGCTFGSGAVISACCGGVLIIGKNVFINSFGGAISAAHEITIGDNTLIADHVVIMNDSYHEFSPVVPRRLAPVSIGRNVWINPGVRINPGVAIGDHAVIGAGAVVTRDVPARSFAAGIPARVVSSFECPDDWVRT